MSSYAWATSQFRRLRSSVFTHSASPATYFTVCAAIAAPNSKLALAMVGEEGRGLIIYEHQEGRGIGLMNKLRAYELQDGGADTVEANEQLGFEADLRVYGMPGAILNYMGVHKVRLLSNNPAKIEALEKAGIEVTERVPCIVAPTSTTEEYLRTKKEKMGHLLEGF